MRQTEPLGFKLRLAITKQVKIKGTRGVRDGSSPSELGLDLKEDLQ